MKQLLPLGFSRASIRKQLHLSGGNASVVACKLQDKDSASNGSSPRDGKEKQFVIATIEVRRGGVEYCSCVFGSRPTVSAAIPAAMELLCPASQSL